jgi:maltose/moltooligosaccharide transporter
MSADTTASATGELTRGRMLLYSAGSIGTGAFYAFNNFVLPPVLKSFGAPDLLIGFLSSTRSLEGALIQPTVGAWSDRTWTRFGRRRPFIVAAIPLSALFFLLASGASSLVQLAILIFLFSIFFNTAVDPYLALLPDVAPLHQRGLLSGLATATQLSSSVLLLLLIASGSGGGVPGWAYDAVAAILLISFAITVLGVPERRERSEPAPAVERVPWRDYVHAILVHRQAVRYLGTLFVYQFGLNAILPYLVLFITDEIHESEQTGFILSATLLMVMAVSAVVFGRLADRIGTRLVLALGWALLAASAVGGVLVTNLAQTTAVVLFAGVGNGAATAANWPLLTALIPPEKTGVFAGLKAAAESVAIPLSVVVAAEIFLPRFGYRGIFAMLAINILLALVLLLRFVRVPPAAEPLKIEPLAV